MIRWRFKLPGRVGDSPVIGSGLYCDGEVGAAVATGDGEEVSINAIFELLKYVHCNTTYIYSIRS
jgi:isoaspartyl peptidase/L-asparaginase-like protein (Ntn-hydrolase superfamily)